MDARFLVRTLCTIGSLSGLWAMACTSGDESLGHDQNAAEQGQAGTQSNGDPNCETIECFRPVECVETCGGPIVQSSCCPCPAGLLDQLIDCPAGTAGGGNSGGTSGSTGAGGHAGSVDPPSGGEGGFSRAGAGGESGTVEPDLNQLHSSCVDDMCPPGLTPMHYYGIAGSSGPLFCSCEIPCEEDPNVCPATTTCVTISDGPGSVCAVN